MSIELKEAAQQALLALEKSQPHPSNPVIGLTKQDFIDHEETIRQLRTAIQQAEAQQPATGEPDVDFDLQELREIERAMDDFADCGETDVSDALLLRGVRAGFLECTHFHVANRGALQDAIDAAMLAAK